MINEGQVRFDDLVQNLHNYTAECIFNARRCHTGHSQTARVDYDNETIVMLVLYCSLTQKWLSYLLVIHFS